MKKRLYKLLILGIVSCSIVFLGCKKDEGTQNNITFNNTKTILSYGAIDSWGVTSHSPATYAYEVILTTKGITYDNTNQEYTGSGSFVSFFIYTSDPNDLLPGTYAFDNFSNEEDLTFDEGDVGFNFNLTTEEPAEGVFNIETGVVNVVRRGGIYVFNIEVYIDHKKQVKAYFAGMLDKHTISKK
jgi:hypothetical protein